MMLRTFEARGWRAAALAFAVASSVSGRRAAMADMISPPPPDCVGQPAGARCVRFNGTAGRCVHVPDSRRPGRVDIYCEADTDECGPLAIGATCHGYLGRPAHCREFSDEQTHRRWRSCVVDESQPDASAPTPTPPAPAPAPPPAPTARPAQPPAPPARSSGCSVRASSNDASHGAWALGVAVVSMLARRRRRSV